MLLDGSDVIIFAMPWCLPGAGSVKGDTLLPLAAALRCLAAAERLPPLDWGALCRGLLDAFPAAAAALASVPVVPGSGADVRQAVLELALAHTDATGVGAHVTACTCTWVVLWDRAISSTRKVATPAQAEGTASQACCCFRRPAERSDESDSLPWARTAPARAAAEEPAPAAAL